MWNGMINGMINGTINGTIHGMSKFHVKSFILLMYPGFTSINSDITLIMVLLFTQNNVIMACRNDIIASLS